MPNVSVDDSTWRELNRRKEPGDTFDDVVGRLLDETAIIGFSLEVADGAPRVHLAGADADIDFEVKVNDDEPIDVDIEAGKFVLPMGDDVEARIRPLFPEER